MNTQNTTPKTPQPKLVQDRKTGEYYDPKAAFDRLMNNRETQAMLRRLSCIKD